MTSHMILSNVESVFQRHQMHSNRNFPTHFDAAGCWMASRYLDGVERSWMLTEVNIVKDGRGAWTLLVTWVCSSKCTCPCARMWIACMHARMHESMYILAFLYMHRECCMEEHIRACVFFFWAVPICVHIYIYITPFIFMYVYVWQMHVIVHCKIICAHVHMGADKTCMNAKIKACKRCVRLSIRLLSS